jgi:cysteine desulfurase
MAPDLVYLDHQSSTPCDPRVLDAMLPWFTRDYGNPHSVDHVMGRTAAAAVEHARAQVAALIGAEAREIVFTSGATEANNLAIKGAVRHARRHGDGGRRRVITLASEHDCVLESVAAAAEDGFEPCVLPVGRDGLVDPERLRDALATPTLLVSIMAVNNELGVIQDIAALAAIARTAGALFHTDAAQAGGRIPLDVRGIDLLSLSGHKLYGPKGVGALYVRRRPRVRLAALFSGGGQERGLRPGTLPAPLIVGFGAACALAFDQRDADEARIGVLRDTLLDRLGAGIPGLRVNGSLAQRIGGNLNLTFPAVSAARIMRALPWLCISTGAACSSAELAPSHVLRAIGVSDDAAARSLRLGLGRTTSHANIARAAAALVETHAALAGAVVAASA